MIKQQVMVLALTSSLVVLQGCVTTSEDIFGDDMTPMKEVYEQKVFGDGLNIRQQIARDIRDNSVHVNAKLHRHKKAFPKLPNPELIMHVFPHITPNGTAVPGYTTAFDLYEKNHYALPGEVYGWK